MKQINLTHKLSSIILFWLLAFYMYSCAQFVPPTGGKKDSIPPQIVKTIPLNKTLNYKEQYVDIEFNEYITVDNLNQQLLITPSIEGNYTTKQRPKGTRINFDKPFKENITYTLNFREAFKDYAERNPAKNVKIVFSTGSKIDSLSVSGKVKNTQTGKPVLDALVGLYKWADTSKIAKIKPYYFTKTDSSGNFLIENIQAGIYRLIAITDINNNILYEPTKENIAYLKDSIEVTKNISGIEMDLFFAENIPQKVVNTLPTAYYYTINYIRGIKKVSVKYVNAADSMAMMQIGERQLKFFNTKSTTDTVKVNINLIDSLDREFKHEQKIKFRPKPKKEEGSREALSVDYEPKVGEETALPFVFKLTFNKPIDTYTLNAIQIVADTIRPIKVEEKDVEWNAYKNVITIKKDLKASRDVRVRFPKGTFMSIEKDSNQVFKHDYPIKIAENYGIISGSVRNAQSNFIVQLTDNANKVLKEVINTPNYVFDYLKPGIYSVRVVVDSNKNNRWDFGDPEKFILPERIIFFPNSLPLKQNFELNGNDIDLGESPPTVEPKKN